MELIKGASGIGVLAAPPHDRLRAVALHYQHTACRHGSAHAISIDSVVVVVNAVRHTARGQRPRRTMPDQPAAVSRGAAAMRWSATAIESPRRSPIFRLTFFGLPKLEVNRGHIHMDEMQQIRQPRCAGSIESPAEMVERQRPGAFVPENGSKIDQDAGGGHTLRGDALECGQRPLEILACQRDIARLVIDDPEPVVDFAAPERGRLVGHGLGFEIIFTTIGETTILRVQSAEPARITGSSSRNPRRREMRRALRHAANARGNCSSIV